MRHLGAPAPPAILLTPEFVHELRQFRDMYLSAMLGPNWRDHPGWPEAFRVMFPTTAKALREVDP